MTDHPGLMIRPPDSGDFDRWSQLYRMYAEFYRTPFTAAIADAVWGWIQMADNGFEGRVVADPSGTVIGLAHFRAYPLPLLGTHGGFIDDIFVDPGARGHGVADLVIEHVVEFGRANGWPTINWLTADNNYRARTVYDRHAKRTDWVTYEIEM
jgi:GNAT superfamily N-acetyltransferase